MATENKNKPETAPTTAKAVGIVIPYVYGGTAQNTAQPLLLIPEHETGPVPDECNTPMTREARDEKYRKGDPAHTWLFIGRAEINGATFKLYGTHASCSRKTAPEAIDAALGDKLRRATADEAKAMAADLLREKLAADIAALRARSPALASMSDAEMLAMFMSK